MKFYEFICQNPVTEENEAFVKKCYKEVLAEEWGKGYHACLRDRVKLKKARGIRRGETIKRFLDFLHDKTYNPNKA